MLVRPDLGNLLASEILCAMPAKDLQPGWEVAASAKIEMTAALHPANMITEVFRRSSIHRLFSAPRRFSLRELEYLPGGFVGKDLDGKARHCPRPSGSVRPRLWRAPRQVQCPKLGKCLALKTEVRSSGNTSPTNGLQAPQAGARIDDLVAPSPHWSNCPQCAFRFCNDRRDVWLAQPRRFIES